ncbi:hypothetical protein [Paenibacillus sp. KS-LC4]|uniref:hypothetical protein n=1 Tax=Paenibacillus sp. KS-LC4 TaxID=2979727 RepID=UPI0030D3AB98
MSIQHTVHFKIIRPHETKTLHGLIFLEENQQPTVEDYAKCLKLCGHDVVIHDVDKFIFKAEADGESYLIDVLEDFEKRVRDLDAENLSRSFQKPNPSF